MADEKCIICGNEITEGCFYVYEGYIALGLFIRRGKEGCVHKKHLKGMDKETPSNCRLQKCRHNPLSPAEKSQECLGCEGNKDKNWDYKEAKSETKD